MSSLLFSTRSTKSTVSSSLAPHEFDETTMEFISQPTQIDTEEQQQSTHIVKEWKEENGQEEEEEEDRESEESRMQGANGNECDGHSAEHLNHFSSIRVTVPKLLSLSPVTLQSSSPSTSVSTSPPRPLDSPTISASDRLPATAIPSPSHLPTIPPTSIAATSAPSIDSYSSTSHPLPASPLTLATATSLISSPSPRSTLVTTTSSPASTFSAPPSSSISSQSGRIKTPLLCATNAVAGANSQSPNATTLNGLKSTPTSSSSSSSSFSLPPSNPAISASSLSFPSPFASSLPSSSSSSSHPISLYTAALISPTPSSHSDPSTAIQLITDRICLETDEEAQKRLSQQSQLHAKQEERKREFEYEKEAVVTHLVVNPCSPFTVLIRVNYCALTIHDLHVAQARYRFLLPPLASSSSTASTASSSSSLIPGSICSGHIVAYGSHVTSLSIDTLVLCLIPLSSRFGACAEYTLQPAINCFSLAPYLHLSLSPSLPVLHLWNSIEAYTLVMRLIEIKENQMILMLLREKMANVEIVKLIGRVGARCIVCCYGEKQWNRIWECGKFVVQVVDLEHKYKRQVTNGNSKSKSSSSNSSSNHRWLLELVMAETGGLGVNAIIDLQDNYIDIDTASAAISSSSSSTSSVSSTSSLSIPSISPLSF